MNKEQLEQKKKEAWLKYEDQFHCKFMAHDTDFNAGFDAGVEAMKEEVEKWKKEVRVEGKAKSEAHAFIEWHQKNFTRMQCELFKVTNLLQEASELLSGAYEGDFQKLRLEFLKKVNNE